MAYGKECLGSGNPFNAVMEAKNGRDDLPKSEIAAFLGAMQREALINREIVMGLAKRLSPITSDAPVRECVATEESPSPSSQLASELNLVAMQVRETNRTLSALMDRLCI